MEDDVAGIICMALPRWRRRESRRQHEQERRESRSRGDADSWDGRTRRDYDTSRPASGWRADVPGRGPPPTLEGRRTPSLRLRVEGRWEAAVGGEAAEGEGGGAHCEQLSNAHQVGAEVVVLRYTWYFHFDSPPPPRQLVTPATLIVAIRVRTSHCAARRRQRRGMFAVHAPSVIRQCASPARPRKRTRVLRRGLCATSATNRRTREGAERVEGGDGRDEARGTRCARWWALPSGITLAALTASAATAMEAVEGALSTAAEGATDAVVTAAAILPTAAQYVPSPLDDGEGTAQLAVLAVLAVCGVYGRAFAQPMVSYLWLL